jgi:hypothetical protein
MSPESAHHDLSRDNTVIGAVLSDVRTLFVITEPPRL